MKMADGVDLDLYADDLEQEFVQEEFGGDGVDLYDDVIASAPGSGVNNSSGGGPPGSGSGPTTNNTDNGNGPGPENMNNIPKSDGGRRHQLYIGNLTWWTTDQDIADAVLSVGVNDFCEVKFFENRANGQSKGFCVVTLGSADSVRICMERLVKKDLHGQNLVVTYPTKHALSHFEAQSKTRRTPPAPNQQDQRGMGMGGPPHANHHPGPQGPPPPGMMMQGGGGPGGPRGGDPMMMRRMPHPGGPHPGGPPQFRGGPPPQGVRPPPPGQGGPPPPRMPMGGQMPPGQMPPPPGHFQQHNNWNGPRQPGPPRPQGPPQGMMGGGGPGPQRPPGMPFQVPPPGQGGPPPPRGPPPPGQGPPPPDQRGPPGGPPRGGPDGWNRPPGPPQGFPPHQQGPPMQGPPPPGQGGPPPPRGPPPPGQMPGLPPPGHGGPPGQPPQPHVNPAFFQQGGGGGGPPQPGAGGQGGPPPPHQPPPGSHPPPGVVHGHGPPPPGSVPHGYHPPPPAPRIAPAHVQYGGGPPPEHRVVVGEVVPPISEPEFEEIMSRNRTVSSSAIARAVSDAAAGEYASAIETLVTAISLIKQSKVANDDRCKILISSLQDTLHGVEAKSYGSSRRVLLAVEYGVYRRARDVIRDVSEQPRFMCWPVLKGPRRMSRPSTSKAPTCQMQGAAPPRGRRRKKQRVGAGPSNFAMAAPRWQAPSRRGQSCQLWLWATSAKPCHVKLCCVLTESTRSRLTRPGCGAALCRLIVSALFRATLTYVRNHETELLWLSFSAFLTPFPTVCIPRDCLYPSDCGFRSPVPLRCLSSKSVIQDVPPPTWSHREAEAPAADTVNAAAVRWASRRRRAWPAPAGPGAVGRKASSRPAPGARPGCGIPPAARDLPGHDRRPPVLGGAGGWASSHASAATRVGESRNMNFGATGQYSMQGLSGAREKGKNDMRR
ncbi:hypothetical protein LSTR_LSTR012469 [Laodelphax striatellus]|uniref:Cleavage and polyadenylation specificity factor subunit 6 n=1 Tax=Laodelphax striatellus TaxID=195883 RepID=A0A482XT15_LAOST|nr:hypothetical protein LSTR_LSTR012469 [Laodelphax striatellus]